MRSNSLIWAMVVPWFVAGCGASGLPSHKETWNSYYYGSAPHQVANAHSFEGGGGGRDSDDNYTLPKGYGGDDVYEAARNPKIPEHNLIPTNPQ